MSSLKPWRLPAEVSSLSWEKWGKILAAGVFAGNPDRTSGVKTNTGLKGWYNLGNIIVSAGTPVAIDNAFRPELVSTVLKQEQGHWGRILAGYQVGIVAAANEQLAFQEAGLLFDVFLDTAA